MDHLSPLYSILGAMVRSYD